MKLLKHLNTINKHKYYVAKCAFKSGIAWQGIVHDLSKYSIVELTNGAKYYTGTSSPIDKERKEVGRCNAWHNHKGRNRHHWEYWVDFVGGEPIAREMPLNYAREVVCDYFAASIVYSKQKADFDKPFPTAYEYWLLNKHKFMFHPNTSNFIDSILYVAKETNINTALAFSKTFK